MEQRIANIESIIPTLATKADLHESIGGLRADFERFRADVNKTVGELRTDFERGQKENRAWMLATVLALFVGVVGAGSYFMSGNQQSASSPAPIIVYATPLAAPLPSTD